MRQASFCFTLGTDLEHGTLRANLRFVVDGQPANGCKKGGSIMFQVELGRMMREEQQRDYRREARRKERAADENRLYPNFARGWVILPLALLGVVARLVLFSTRSIRL